MTFGAKSKLNLVTQGRELKHAHEYRYLGAIRDIKAKGRKNQIERLQKIEVA